MIVAVTAQPNDLPPQTQFVDLDKISSDPDEIELARAIREALVAQPPYEGEAGCKHNALCIDWTNDGHGNRRACFPKLPLLVEAECMLYAND